MTPAVNDSLIGSGGTAHAAGPSTGHQHAWEPSWLPGRNAAVTAMMLPGIVGPPGLHSARRLRPAAEPHKNSGRQPKPPPAREAGGP